ncbi:MAG: PKD domain-containing protein [Thermoplasmatota archaeon]
MSRSTNHGYGGFSKALVAAAVVGSLLVMAVPALASSGSVTAAIKSPASGATYDRVTAIAFQDGSTQSSCPITSWAWSFGDGSTATIQNPSYTYSTLGTFTVALTVTGSCSGPASQSTARITVNIVNDPPTAALSGPANSVAGVPVTFNASASADKDGTIISYNFTVDGKNRGIQGSPLTTLNTTVAGKHTVSVLVMDNEGATGSATVTDTVGPAALSNITVAGPSQVVVNTSATYTFTGVDQYNNTVKLNKSSVVFTAPKTVGTAYVTYTQANVTGSETVSVIAGPLATIDVTGPTSPSAGSTVLYFLAGLDPYGNVVPLNQSNMTYQVPTKVGSATVSYSQKNSQGKTITGSLKITVVAAALARITVSGSTTDTAGDTYEYTLAGYDIYGNSVTLNNKTINETFTIAGTAYATYTQANVTGSLAVTVVHNVLASIQIVGPGRVAVGSTTSYQYLGYDRYLNPVPLKTTSGLWTANTTPGTMTVTHTENSITGRKYVTIAPGPIAKIVVSGPSQLVVNQTQTYTATTYDSFNNVNSTDTFAFTAPKSVGSASACYTANSVTGCFKVDVLVGPLATITVSGPAELAENAQVLYMLSGADAFGNPVSLKQTELLYTAPATAGTFSVTYTEGSVTGSESVVVTVQIASITVSGPNPAVAGSTDTYTFSAVDTNGNATPVPLTSETLFIGKGPVVISQTVEGVTGSLTVDVTPGPIATVTVSGPALVAAGASVTYTNAGFDQYGNPAAIGNATETFSQTLVGTYSVCDLEGSVSGCETVTVEPAAPATVDVTLSASSANVNEVVTATVTAADAYGNAITVAPTFSATHGSISSRGVFVPGSAGTATITAVVKTDQGVKAGSASLTVSNVLVNTASVTPSSATFSSLVNGGSVVISDVTTLQDGTAARGMHWSVSISPVTGGPSQAVCTASQNAASGSVSYTVPTQCTAPGTYTVSLTTLTAGNSGSTTLSYTVTVG